MIRYMIVVVGALAIASFVFASNMSTDLANGNHEGSIGETPFYPDDWVDPTGDPSTWDNGLAFYGWATSEWPELDASFANYIELDLYGVDYEAKTDECEVAVMNDSGFNNPVNIFIMGDDGGYPDGDTGDDALWDVEVDTSGWSSGTYPAANWNSVALSDWGPLPNELYFCMHTYWSGGGYTFDFYTALEYDEHLPDPPGEDCGWMFVSGYWQTNTQYNSAYAGAWGLRFHTVETGAVEETSLGVIKALF
ncbi:MAG: hypothetical protein DRH44_02130 [Candidatus Coatesbacteria bacterium]|nr:MAG: hypothetical protein DRH44_02130 [Candidatus Coatesbacteria bacterium]